MAAPVFRGAIASFRHALRGAVGPVAARGVSRGVSRGAMSGRSVACAPASALAACASRRALSVAARALCATEAASTSQPTRAVVQADNSSKQVTAELKWLKEAVEAAYDSVNDQRGEVNTGCEVVLAAVTAHGVPKHTETHVPEVLRAQTIPFSPHWATRVRYELTLLDTMAEKARTTINNRQPELERLQERRKCLPIRRSLAMEPITSITKSIALFNRWINTYGNQQLTKEQLALVERIVALSDRAYTMAEKIQERLWEQRGDITEVGKLVEIHMRQPHAYGARFDYIVDQLRQDFRRNQTDGGDYSEEKFQEYAKEKVLRQRFDKIKKSTGSAYSEEECQSYIITVKIGHMSCYANGYTVYELLSNLTD